MTELRAPLRASLHLALARALYAHSRTAAARQQAATARSLLEHWPGWRRDEVDAELSRLDSAATKEGQLTPREREVAALLGEGLSNSELARRLYISPRTAAVHVSNILVKLGMSSRAEVAAWAVRNGLTAA
jgi:DNA-binding NarL/FixJ family response regulator